MMQLAITKRDSGDDVAALRASGKVPGVFYGRKEASTPIAIDARVFKKLWRDAGETTIITLEGIDEPKDSLIREVSVHPVTGEPEHVDFYVLEKGKKLTIAVPIEFTGVAGAEKEGGVTVKVLHEVEIEVEPRELPQHLVVDLSQLQKIGDHITVSQIPVPPSAVFITDPEEIVVSVTEQKIVEDMPTTPPTEEEVAAAEGAKAETSSEEKSE